jgi:hypothetical protein
MRRLATFGFFALSLDNPSTMLTKTRTLLLIAFCLLPYLCSFAEMQVLRSDNHECQWSYRPGLPEIEKTDTVNPHGILRSWEDTGIRVGNGLMQPVKTAYVVVPYGTVPELRIVSVRTKPMAGGLAGKPSTVYAEEKAISVAWAVLTKVEDWRGFRLAHIEMYPLIGSDVSSTMLDEITISVSFKGDPLPGGDHEREGRMLKSIALNGEQATRWWQLKSPIASAYSVTSWPDYNLYRIAVEETGLYQMSGDWLRLHGVDFVTQPVQINRIKLFGNGGKPLPWSTTAAIPTELAEDAIYIDDVNGDGLFNEQDRILFYGKARKDLITAIVRKR